MENDYKDYVRMEVFDVFIFYGMIGLFVISFISSIIPIPTEPVVFGLLGAGGNAGYIFITLTSGSILGASAGYFMGNSEIWRIVPLDFSLDLICCCKYF